MYMYAKSAELVHTIEEVQKRSWQFTVVSDESVKL